MPAVPARGPETGCMGCPPRYGLLMPILSQDQASGVYGLSLFRHKNC
jgi:hypothetical protein